ncbi:MAG: autotransporter-associated beta strand repeat-containing protein [Tepidisphaeraceae bacterium]
MRNIPNHRRRAALAACIAGIAGAAFASSAKAQNLLLDPGFEAGIDGAPDASSGDVPMSTSGPWSGWNNWLGPYSGYYASSVDDGLTARTGTQMGKTFSGPNGGIYQDVAVTAGDSYTASAWFDNSSTANGGIDLLNGPETDDVRMIFFSGPSGTGNGLGTYVTPVPVSDLTPTDTWTQLSVTATAPAGTVSVQWMAFFNNPGYSGGALFVDDASLIQNPANLTWSNAGGNKLWDTTTSANWNNGTTTTVFNAQDNVAFDDTSGGNYAVTLNTTVSPGSVTVNNSAGNYTISGAGGIAGTGSLTKMGSDTLTLSTVNTYSGGTTVSAGTLVVGVKGALPDQSLTITGGEVQLAANTGLAQLTSLSISSGAVLDLTNNHLFINYGSNPDPIAAIRTYLMNGYNGGTWNGTGGIDSSAAALPANSAYSIGYADSADPGNPAGLSSGTIEVKYTLLGDATLTGTVTGTDFTILATNLGKSGLLNWDQGNFLYSPTGTITGSDFTALVTNLGKTASGGAVALPAADWAAVDAFAAANGLMADVPEPASIGLLTLGAIGLLTPRRRTRLAIRN